MRQATGGQMHTLRRAGERLAAEVAASPCSAACSMSAGRPASRVAAWCGAAARACGLQNGSRAHHSLASSLCSTTMQGSSASGAAVQHVARLAIAGTRPSLALSLLPAGMHGRLLASRSHHAAATAPSRWLLRQLLGTTAKLPPRARLRAEFGTVATAAARRAATAAARRKSLNPVPTRWAIARRQLMQRAEWVLGRGYHAREAFCNAVYIQPNWSKSLLLLLAERITRGDPRLAWCFSTPVQESEDQLCQQPSEDPTNLRALQRARRLAASLLRLAWLLVLFSPVVLAAPLVGFPYIGITRLRWLRLLRWTLERAGPAFIKWGQWAATRHDLFPPDFCDELELLHTQAPAHALPFTESTVREAFGFGVSDLFSSFEAEPVASGSIGQIHKGLLSDTGARLTGMPQGTVVAVKVRHPGVSESIERDFALMMAAARVAAHLPALSALRLEESLKQFAAPLREQVDLAREATHLHAFNYNFRKTSGVSFPVPLYPLVHAAVLTETFEPGTHISEYVARGAGAPHNSELARLGARTMLHMMIVDNLIHADLHPGNILVNLDYPLGGANGPIGLVRRLAAATGAHSVVETLDGWRKAKLVLLDAGMAMRLSPDDQRNMFGLFESFAQMDGTRLAHWALQFSGEEQSCPDPEVFVGEVAAFFERLTAETVATGATHGAEALAEVLELVRTHSVNMPGHICATVVTTMVLEGWSNKLDPNHSTLQEVKRMVMAVKGGWRGQLAEIMLRGELAADSEIMKRVELLEPALVRV